MRSNETLPKIRLHTPTVTITTSQRHQRTERTTGISLGSSAGGQASSRNGHISEAGEKGGLKQKENGEEGERSPPTAKRNAAAGGRTENLRKGLLGLLSEN
ncbi:hypothetical protein BRARA_C01446 [Brassica rapa]|uniref:Uncharacterized protein n=1 Tax=Brassica campestris TaxID=3711 RepID=A0A397ZWJ9_BRACM|nr:hypothetical protein BRARA_C01446 [Brassica rapa]